MLEISMQTARDADGRLRGKTANVVEVQVERFALSEMDLLVMRTNTILKIFASGKDRMNKIEYLLAEFDRLRGETEAGDDFTMSTMFDSPSTVFFWIPVRVLRQGKLITAWLFDLVRGIFTHKIEM